MSEAAALCVTVLDEGWRPCRLLPVVDNWTTLLHSLLSDDHRWIALLQRRPAGEAATPRRDDIILTRAVIRSIKPLDLHVADHLIAASDQWFSFRAAGLL